jgi:hypothetical protein
MRFPVTIELADFPGRFYNRTRREMQQRFSENQINQIPATYHVLLDIL